MYSLQCFISQTLLIRKDWLYGLAQSINSVKSCIQHPVLKPIPLEEKMRSHPLLFHRPLQRGPAIQCLFFLHFYHSGRLSWLPSIVFVFLGDLAALPDCQAPVLFPLGFHHLASLL
jgi:hypothetical protein